MKIVPVLQGNVISLPVEGGWRRKPAPCDGYYIDDDWSAFIPAETLQVATAELEAMQAQRLKQMRRRTRERP